MKYALLLFALAAYAQPVKQFPAGAPSTFNLTDCALVITSNTVVTLGPLSSSSTPCQAQFGTQTFTLATAAATATRSTGSATAFFYGDNAGTLSVGSTDTLTGSGMTYVAAITAFPVTAVPIGSCAATSGVWTSCTMFRGFLRRDPVACGFGLICTQTAAVNTLAVDPSILTNITLPATLTGTGSQAFTLSNTTASTSGTQQSSPLYCINGTLWTGTSTSSSFCIQNVSTGATPMFTVTLNAPSSNNPQIVLPTGTNILGPALTLSPATIELGNSSQLTGDFGNGTFTFQDQNTPTHQTAIYAGTGNPAITSCGTSPTVDTNSTDWYGHVTEGSVATGCVITFSGTHTAAPSCTVVPRSGLGASYTVSNTAITITNIGSLSSTVIDWTCGGPK